ncbi:MAG TPA: DUF1707 domain-containing protein [Acidimicrobiales bacterium]|jgi:hypothetical protein|nr:DUF1707 domain-containing protein [Acidimicrobiales bacterium]
MGGPSSRLRASDRDREEAAARLRGHFTDGRLQADELAERLDQVYRAKTFGDLDGAFTDLPGRPAHWGHGPSALPAPAEGRDRPPAPVTHRPPRIGLLVGAIILLALAVAPGAHGLLFPGVVLAVLWVRRMGGGCRGPRGSTPF